MSLILGSSGAILKKARKWKLFRAQDQSFSSSKYELEDSVGCLSSNAVSEKTQACIKCQKEVYPSFQNRFYFCFYFSFVKAIGNSYLKINCRYVLF